jgi:hypothetical protein
VEGDSMVASPNVFYEYTVPNPLLWAGSQVLCVIITISVTSNHINYFFTSVCYIYVKFSSVAAGRIM